MNKKIAKKQVSKKKIILFVALGVTVLVGFVTTLTLLLLAQINYRLVDNPTFEVNSENTIAQLFAEVAAGTIEDPDDKIDTSTTGKKSRTVTIVSSLGTKQTIEIFYYVNDTIPPIISGEDELSFQVGEAVNLLDHFRAEDNSGQDAKITIEGAYDMQKSGEYKIKIIARDESDNQNTKEVTLKITEPPQATSKTVASGALYYIEVNRQQNVVIVYSRDQSGGYSHIAKVFVASTGAPGSETPLGTFTTSNKYESLYLVGNVWGHYTVRINGPYFFHSVPYFSKGNPVWDNLEYLEYNKLGSGASAGCVRLAAIDAKWIYDNIDAGTTVKIYDSPNLPQGVTKPQAIRISETDPKRGWDPTDPDSSNPWH